LEEGLSIVQGVRDRHDGERRNPWNEFECGNHYARSMSSWALLTALSGFYFDLSERTIGFTPRLHPSDFRTFWSVGSGWGTYSQKITERGTAITLTVLYGSLPLAKLYIGSVENAQGVGAIINERSLPVPRLERGERGLSVVFERPLELRAGDVLRISLE